MLYPIKVIDIELSQGIPTLENLDRYIAIKALIRLQGVPLGYVDAPVILGQCSTHTLSNLILDQYQEAIWDELLKQSLLSSQRPKQLRIENSRSIEPTSFDTEMPRVTVAVCTRDRPEDMILCLEAINQLDYPNLDILVIDNAPQTRVTQDLIEAQYPKVRYVVEPRPGLDWARNRAILEAEGDVIAYTDDDVIVDPQWIKSIVQTFSDNPAAMAITGLVVPYELETKAQVLFEANGGFGKGFQQKKFHVPPTQPMPWWMYGAGQFGTGANMAYRRSIFSQIGLFDPALDVGTPTNGGGDLEMFFRVLKEGYGLIYEPKAIVRHRHRRSHAKLVEQITNNGIGLYSYLVRSALHYPRSIVSILGLGLYWLITWNIRRAWIAFKHPTRLPKDIIWGELWGTLLGILRYPLAYLKAKRIARSFGSQSPEIEQFKATYRQASQDAPREKSQVAHPEKCPDSVAVRQIRLESPLQSIQDIQAYPSTRFFITYHSDLLGHVEIRNHFEPLGARTLAQHLVQHLGPKLLKSLYNLDPHPAVIPQNPLRPNYRLNQNSSFVPLPKSIKVSINLATYDRPDDLRNCLTYLHQLETNREVEIIVVDNHPTSQLTPPVVQEFPDVILINEPRQGLAYARNAGFVASTGEIVIATDDDVTIPPDWLEKLIAPFSRADVGIVTGNVLPLQLETPSQQFFEQYGGLGKGYEQLEADLEWFESSPRYAIPTWKLGATANAAFRSSILADPEVGLMDEALGPGMPSGVGEDTYLFYRAIKAGYALIYEPSAYVWHRHRREPAALRRQLYGYSKGHVSYNLTTWLRDGDWRGLYQILIGLSTYHAYRIVKWLLRKDTYPISLIFLEIWGNLAGPWSLFRSHCRVQSEGKSAGYIPVHQRSAQGDTIASAIDPELAHSIDQ